MQYLIRSRKYFQIASSRNIAHLPGPQTFHNPGQTPTVPDRNPHATHQTHVSCRCVCSNNSKSHHPCFHNGVGTSLQRTARSRAQATEGRLITQFEAAAIAHAESDMTGRGPIPGGAAATAQGLHDRQPNFLAVAGEVARKPSEEVTQEDAAKVQRFLR